MAEYPDTRISATERDRALVELSDHFSSGRLDVSDYEERTSAAVEANTTDELAALFADLPGAPHPPGEDRTTLPWPTFLVAGSVFVALPLAYLHSALWLVLIPMTVGVWVLARRDR